MAPAAGGPGGPLLPQHANLTLTRAMNEHSFAMATATETESFRGTSKRERILRAAIDVFAEFGYFNAKVAQIAKSAGVAAVT